MPRRGREFLPPIKSLHDLILRGSKAVKAITRIVVFAAGLGRFIVGHGIGFRVDRWLLKNLGLCVLKAVDFALVVVVDAGGRWSVIVEDVCGIWEEW